MTVTIMLGVKAAAVASLLASSTKAVVNNDQSSPMATRRSITFLLHGVMSRLSDSTKTAMQSAACSSICLFA